MRNEAFFAYYSLELSQIFSMRLKFLNFFRVKTFTFLVLQYLFQFEGAFTVRNLKTFTTPRVSQVLASMLTTQSLDVSKGLMSLISTYNVNTLLSIFSLSQLRSKTLYSLTRLLSIINK